MIIQYISECTQRQDIFISLLTNTNIPQITVDT